MVDLSINRRTMKAAVLHANSDLRYEDCPVPEPGQGEALIRVKAAGICGSDIPRVLNDGAHYYPIVLGHEFSGEVVQTGPGVTSVQPGDRVTAAPLLPCHACADCRRGDYALCRHYSFIGSRVQGSFAQYVKAPEQNLVKFAENVPWEQAAFFEPSTVALHGLMRVPYRGGEDVAVLGGGTIGILTAQWARIFGAKRVAVLDIDSDRLALARQYGADAVIHTLETDFMKKAMDLTGGRGFGYVYETAGADATMKMAFELAANKAGVCFIGTPGKDLVLPPRLLENILRREFTLTGSWMSYSAPFPGREWALTAHFMGTGALKVGSDMIFRRFPLSQAADAFALFTTPADVKGKVLLVPEQQGDPVHARP
jgi:L-iditol 2-dehydrogenase